VFNGPDNLGGPEDSDHDVFLALRQWVEDSMAPKRIIGTKYVGDNPANGIAFTRPMCPYPQRAQYRGSGATEAVRVVSAAPAGEPRRPPASSRRPS
jgi:feruloyl esterase